MLRKYGFFILLVIVVVTSLLATNIRMQTRTITTPSFYENIENAVTDEKGNLWVLFKDKENYSVIRYSSQNKIEWVLDMKNKNSDTRLISKDMYVDQNENLFITKSTVDNTTGLIKQESVVKIGDGLESPEEIFRIDYKNEDNIWVPALSHIACEGNNLFIVMNEISSIKVFCVSISNKEAVKTEEYIPAGDVYIDSVVRLENGVIVFSTKNGIIYTVKNKEQAVRIYPEDANTVTLSKLQSVSGNKVRFSDESTGNYISMAYMDFDPEILLQADDSILSKKDHNLVYGDANQIFTGSNGLVVSPVKYKGGMLLLYGSIDDLKDMDIINVIRSIKRINIIINVLVFFAACCLTVVLWQVYLYFDIKYFRKKKTSLPKTKKNDSF